MVNKLLSALLDQLAPFYCAVCNLPSERAMPLCIDCEAEIPRTIAACETCALPLPAASRYCGRCLTQPPPLRTALAASPYTAPVDELIRAFKFSRQVELTAPLTQLMLAPVSAHLQLYGPPDALVPMPLHWRRHWHRGYNQAELLACALARHPALQNWQLQVRRLARRRHARPNQQGLDRKTRLGNLRGAFSANGDLNGLQLVIVDDVITTGASAGHLARALLTAGATSVDLWCCARTPAPGSSGQRSRLHPASRSAFN
jgi:ComF family protein